jgi:hypothetical protein
MNQIRKTLTVLLVATVASSCGGSPAQPDPAQVAVSLSPASAQVAPAAIVPFTATVTGSAVTAVVWSVQGGSPNGTVDGSGVYTAPSSAGQYVVVATSVADGRVQASATVTVTSPSAGVSVAVSPKTRSLGPGGSVTFTATVAGSNDTSVTWSVQGGNANGTVTSGGLYTAPAGAGTYTVTATSNADASKSDAAAVTVTVVPTAGAGLQAQLATLSGKAIFFGHASVGENIIDGIMALEDGNQGPEPAVTNQSGASASAVASAMHPGVLFGNGWGIPNGDLVPKIAIFESTLRGGVGAVADIAMMKPCFSDFPGRSTPQEAFDAYVAALTRLKALYPQVTFVHFTSPISSVNPDNVNAHREAYSDLMRARFRGVEPFFDIAVVESTDPSGNAVRLDGSRAMYPGYTSDGGHLNSTGQEVVARALVEYLAGLP